MTEKLMLDLSLTLPDVWILASVVIVTQTLVELIGELIYIRFVPSIISQESKDLEISKAFSYKGKSGKTNLM